MMIGETDHKYIASLVIRVQHNDSDAFTDLYGMTYNKVYNYARHYLRDDFLAQDAVQEVYILALKNISRLNDPSLFVAWINQIAFRVCFDMCKKNNSAYGDITDPELLEILRDENEGHDPAATFQKSLEIELLHKAIDELPAHEKQCIVLRYYNNMRIEDIGDVLGFSRSSVKRYITSARDHLAEAIRG